MIHRINDKTSCEIVKSGRDIVMADSNVASVTIRKQDTLPNSGEQAGKQCFNDVVCNFLFAKDATSLDVPIFLDSYKVHIIWFFFSFLRPTLLFRTTPSVR